MTPSESLKALLTRPLLWALVYGALIVYGAYALLHIPIEVLPRFDFPQIRIVTHYPGASATELETLIVRPIESQLLTLPNLVSVRSTMGHGEAQTEVRFRDDTNAQADLQTVNGAIDRARAQLPGAAHPYAQIMGNAINEVADYTVEIPPQVAPAAVQRAIRTRVAPALRALPGVQRVEVYGTGDEALWIEPHLDALHRYGIAVTALVRAVKDHVLLRPAGYLSRGHQHILIEARSLPTHSAALGRIGVPGPDGPVPLRDLARIVRAAVPAHHAVLLDGRPSIALTILKQPGASTIPVDRAIASTLARTQDQLPKGVHWVRIYSQGHLVQLIFSDLGRNLLVGAVLAMAVLLWVLGAGRGIWALALSIPLALLLGIAGLYASGHDLDLMTLGALTVAVGLLADDAIIVLESIYHRWERGAQHWEGIRQGVGDIAGPDVTGTLTTVSVFAPLLFVGGLAGLFFVPFAVAMALALLASLLISLTLIPLGLGFIGARPPTRITLAGRAIERLRRANTHLFDWVLRRPRLSLFSCIALLLVSVVGLVVVPMDFLPLPNEGVMLESFSLPPGTALSQTEATVRSMTRRLRADPAVAHTYARIGSSAGTGYTEPSYAGEIQIALKPDINVNTLDRIGQRLLKESATPGVQSGLDTPTIERTGESLSGLPQPFVIRLFGNRIATLRALSMQVTQRLRHAGALSDIFNNDAYPITQLQLLPKPRALTAFGLTPAALYSQLDPLIGGEVLAKVPDGNYPLDIYMRLAGAPQNSLAGLRRLPIRTAGWTPLGALATLKLIPTPNQIRHIDGARALEILATPTGTLGSAVAAAKRTLAGLHLPAGYRISFGGLYAQLEHAALGLVLAGIAAFVLMLSILVLQFDGLLVPALLLLQIPLAVTGGALALVLSGVGLNAAGLIAFLTLIGISLNHGIVLLHRVRRNEAAGLEPETAVREAIQVRFRPIVLTTLTAVLGMLPTAAGWGQGAAPEQGLAIVVMGGILWSALLSTNLIPALYLYRRRKQGGAAASAQVPRDSAPV